MKRSVQLFGTTLVVAVYAPDSSKDMELDEACVSSVLRVLREGCKGGAKKVLYHWRSQRGSGDDGYRRKRHRGAQQDIWTFMLAGVRPQSRQLQKIMWYSIMKEFNRRVSSTWSNDDRTKEGAYLRTGNTKVLRKEICRSLT